jgi:hypothetical protein
LPYLGIGWLMLRRVLLRTAGFLNSLTVHGLPIACCTAVRHPWLSVALTSCPVVSWLPHTSDLTCMPSAI